MFRRRRELLRQGRRTDVLGEYVVDRQHASLVLLLRPGEQRGRPERRPGAAGDGRARRSAGRVRQMCGQLSAVQRIAGGRRRQRSRAHRRLRQLRRRRAARLPLDGRRAQHDSSQRRHAVRTTRQTICSQHSLTQPLVAFSHRPRNRFVGSVLIFYAYLLRCAH